MNRLLLGTGNQGKILEFRELFSSIDISILTLDDFPSIKGPVESGTTFEQNAKIKAAYYARACKCPALADDSGLEVAFLDNRPGIYSARYAGENATDADNLEQLLDDLRGVSSEQRGAKFRCAIAISDTTGNILHTVFASCEGKIDVKPCGINGFGYDPVFIPNGFEQTFGELPDSVKHSLSHRSASAKLMAEFLSENSAMLA